MADQSYQTEVQVSTTQAVANLRTLKAEVTQMTTAFSALNTVVKEGEGDFKSMVASVTSLMAAQRQAAAAEKDLAAAKVATAKANALEQAATDKSNESYLKQEVLLNNALAAEARATASREDSAAKQALLSQQTARTEQATANDRLRVENQLANGYIQREAAQQRAAQAEEQHSAKMNSFAAANSKAAQSQLELTDNLSNTRYLLYDVGATYTAMAAGLEAIPVAVSAVAAAYQNDFAQVARVTDNTVQGNQQLYKSLEQIATEIPMSFGQLTQVAQLGAQLGISNDQLAAFTDTTAKFSAVTQVSTDVASQAFGRLASSFDANNQVPDFFNKVGSSIAEVGAKTVATDPQIIQTVTNINAAGAAAGFTAEQTIGLAAALASVQVQPYLARGTLTRIFGDISKAADGGGKSLDAWGKQLGISADQAAALWKNDPSQFFTQFVASLNKAHAAGGNITQMLNDLGIKSSNDVSAMTKLAVGYDTLTLSMKSAADGYQSGQTLNEQAAVTFDTLVSKLEILKNTLGNLGADLGAGVLGPLQGFVGMITEVVKALDGLVNSSPAVKTAINGLLAISLVTGAFFAFKAVQAFVLAGLVSFQQMLGSSAAGAMTTGGILRQFAATMLVNKGASDEMANAMVRGKTAIEALGTAASTSKAKIQEMKTVTSELGDATVNAGGPADALGTKIGNLGNTIKNVALGSIPMLAVALGTTLVTAIVSAQQEAKDAAQAIADAFAQGGQDQQLTEIAKQLKTVKLTALDTLDPNDWNTSLADLANRAGVSMQSVITAVSKGTDGVKAFKQELLNAAKDHPGTGVSGDNIFGVPGTWGGDVGMLEKHLTELANQETTTSDTSKKVNDALTNLGAGAKQTGQDVADTGTQVDTLDKKLKAINDTIFGSIDAQAALGDAMEKLGGSLQKGGSFGNDTVGRENLKNFEDTLAKAQQYYAQFYQQTGDATAAAQGYAQFVQALIDKVQAKGGDLGSVKDLANQTIDEFKSTIGAGTSGANAPTIKVNADGSKAVEQATNTGRLVAQVAEGAKASVQITANGASAAYSLQALAQDIATITGKPYQMVLTALTDPADKNAAEMQSYITQIVNGTYKSTITADTSPAIARIQAYAQYAATVVAQVDSWTSSDGKREGTVQSLDTSNPNWKTAGPAQSQATPIPLYSDSSSSAPTPPPVPDFGNLDNGYQNAADAAAKAGAAGKKAGKDTANAWKDAYNGINEAASAANEYAQRLQQGLTNAYDRQYGLSKATDDYYETLNKITQKRQQELDQVSKLQDQLKQAQDEMNKDNIDAQKAQVEASISLKYGDTKRAADYQNQAQTALDNAAAKKKDIDATQKQIDTTQAGIGALTGYSDAAIQNRRDIEDLESKMLAMVDAYAKTGATSEQVRAYAQKLGVQFQQQAGDAFQNQSAVDNLTGDMNRYIGVVNSVPYIKPTTVTANTQPATDAINGFKNWANSQSATITVNDDFKYTLVPNGIDGATGQQIYGLDKLVGYNSDGSAIYDGTGTKVFNKGGLVGYADGGLIPGQSPSDPSIDNLLAQVDGRGMVKVRSGEFIMQQRAVDFWGRDFMNAINAMKMPAFNSGGSVGRASAGSSSGFPVMNLSAESLKALANAVAAINVNLWTSDQIIAQSNNRGQTLLATKGIYG